MAKYRKKPVVIEARKWVGGLQEAHELIGWVNEGLDPFANSIAVLGDWGVISIRTLEGNMTTQHGDWIIKGVKGEFYPCKDDIFEATYELVVDDE